MKYWIITPIKPNEGPWDPWYDACFGMVIAAESEKGARELASQDYSAEGSNVWLDEKLTKCSEINYLEPQVILRDVANA